MMPDSIRDRLPAVFHSPGEKEPNWPYFIALHSAAGLRWVEEFGLPENLSLKSAITRALALLRSSQIERGRAVLERTELELKSVERAAPAVFNILARWQYGALAYYFHIREEFERAEWALARAHHAVSEAIGSWPFLIPFAPYCYDCALQRVRILRNQRRWPEMQQQIAVARQIFMGELPFCMSTNGTPVDLKGLRDFYRSMPDLDAEEREPLKPIFDEELRRRFLEWDIARIFAMPGFVIPYLPRRE